MLGAVTEVAAHEDAQILVVDDEENITYLLGTALRHFGFSVETADSGTGWSGSGDPNVSASARNAAAARTWSGVGCSSS